MNKNNYLCVTLPDAWRDALSSFCHALGDDNFRPMEHDDLHMTFCFLGEHMQHMKREKIVGLHSELVETQKGIVIQPNFQRFTLFPPEKMNVLVVVLEGFPAAVQGRHGDVVRIMSAGTGDDIAAKNNSNWLPHITLGKIQGPAGAAQEVLAAAQRLADGFSVAGGCVSRDTSNGRCPDFFMP